MEHYKLIEAIFNDISEIPYSIFLMKFGLSDISLENRFEGFCFWLSLTEKQRQKAFTDLIFQDFDKSISITDYLQSYKN